MTKDNLTGIRVRPTERDKLNSVKREISNIENKDIKMPEVMRRITRIPNLRTILISDAEAKKRLFMGKGRKP